MSEKNCILVCVTVQKDCARLIREGRRMAEEKGERLHVLHVSAGKNPLGNPAAAEALNELFSLAHEVDAEMNILYDANVVDSIVRYAKEQSASLLVLGPDHSGIAGQLRVRLPETVELHQMI